MEIRKNNIEIRKNWNRFSFKKLGIVFCLFLFGVVTFVSGNLSQVNAASSSTVLPVAKGGTGSNSASQALINLGKVNSINANSTDNQFPSAKSVYENSKAIYSYNAANLINTTYWDISNTNYVTLTRNASAVTVFIDIYNAIPMDIGERNIIPISKIPNGYKPKTLADMVGQGNTCSVYSHTFSENYYFYFSINATSGLCVWISHGINQIPTGGRFVCQTNYFTDDSFPTA
ncbi:MAG: hypothetical protein LBT99_00355 [Bifidobacteriaceae bacterium]|jgi:hypothetical protein|nr:hypothetical protein [Bifidobacteriaceae bacterium]